MREEFEELLEKIRSNIRPLDAVEIFDETFDIIADAIYFDEDIDKYIEELISTLVYYTNSVNLRNMYDEWCIDGILLDGFKYCVKLIKEDKLTLTDIFDELYNILEAMNLIVELYNIASMHSLTKELIKALYMYFGDDEWLLDWNMLVYGTNDATEDSLNDLFDVIVEEIGIKIGGVIGAKD